MKYTPIPLVAAVAAASMAGASLTQQCSGSAVNEGGNFFCGAVQHILYQGIGGSGSYEAVKSMSATGECQKETKTFDGPLAPLDEGLSLHFRGPIHLKEVAVYTLSSKNKQRRQEVAAEKTKRGHGHQQFHEAKKMMKKNKRTEWITATINGDVVSWEKVNYGPPTAAPPPPAAAAAAPTVPAAAPVANANAGVEASNPGPAPAVPAGAATKAKPAASGKDWDRTSYYNAETQEAENLVFLANYGGQGSGVFDTVWGSSLSYLNANGDGGASSAQVLANVDIPSNKEFAIFSGEPCDGSCGFSRAKDVAYKGFEGTHKIFLFNFKMPMDGNTGFNGDMPAIWALNADIPRTAQYNACSCWPKCGEFDFFEVLAKGDTKCKSTVHLANGGGSSDYFARPVDAYMKGAVIFDADAGVSIRVLPDDTDFSKGLDDATVQAWVASGSSGSAGSSTGAEGGGIVSKIASSVFQIAGSV
ncbi:PGA52-like protein [Beauveria bassiana]|uniref:glucan endo-1,3-beta-D-glucosidase n=1 Tax=Beauveria bassiana TaxID=176275 RepID=A0A2N6NF65_BEABA|nr:PGA52-like protein [Beauveria bassiana]